MTAGSFFAVGAALTSFYQSLQDMSSFMHFPICATYCTLSADMQWHDACGCHFATPPLKKNSGLSRQTAERNYFQTNLSHD